MAWRSFVAVLAVLAVLLPAGAALQAQQPAEAPAQGDQGPAQAASQEKPPAQPAADDARNDSPARDSWIDILLSGGPIGWVIIVLSIVAVALVVEHALSIRAAVLMPSGLAQQVRDMLRAGQVPQAVQHCKLQPSVLSQVLLAGLSELEGRWNAVEKAMEDALAHETARLYRKIEYLSVIGNIAPMLGLLGTVIGMIQAFREVAATQGAARAADLAQGIYLALVTTVEGLVVAIPSLAAYAIFRNRVDQLMAEVAYTALHVFTPFKRRRGSGERNSG